MWACRALVIAGVVGLALPAQAVPWEAGLSRFERPAAFARDQNFNRAITRSPMGPRSTATAQGNLVSVQQEGRGNTLILNLEQTNTGAVSADAVLNGSLDLD